MHSTRQIFELTRRISLPAKIAFALVFLHLSLFAFVVTKPIYYDSGGIMGLLWWLGALWVLPISALVVVLAAALNRWLQQRSNRED